jgi:hypothetical protein
MAQPEPPNAASTILWWLRRPGHERQLMDCLGELARIDRVVAYGVSASVLEAAQEYGKACTHITGRRVFEQHSR